MSRLITRKPLDNTKLSFPKMGAKPPKKQTADIENKADAAKPGDAAEDAKDASQQKGSAQGSKKKPNKSANFFAKKASTALAGGKSGDVGKPNNGKTTGFDVVAKKAASEYGSAAAGDKVAGAVLQKIKAKKG